MIVSDPGTYMYFDPTRPAASCRPLFDTGSKHNCASFTEPSAAEKTACDAYDGLSNGLYPRSIYMVYDMKEKGSMRFILLYSSV
jgi:hypothetical protein